MSQDISRRLGVFTVAMKVLDADLLEGAPMMKALMAKVIPLEIYPKYVAGTLEYTAISPEFAEVPQGQIIPLYRPLFLREGESLTVSFERVQA